KLTQFIRGWINYFALADMRALLKRIDEWYRHRIRTVYWKQWNKVKTKFMNLKKLGIDEENEKLREWGYMTFTEQYLKVRVN
ncbi:MAG: group II intron reverse transcriptase/maturase, partial [Clostridiales bacterium]|nr:group II intron reverse transcriptase/maturase [Clostridiales bacterium]